MIVMLAVLVAVISLGLWATIAFALDFRRGRAGSLLPLIVIIALPLIGPLWYLVTRSSRQAPAAGAPG